MDETKRTNNNWDFVKNPNYWRGKLQRSSLTQLPYCGKMYP